ncbi:MAG: dTMP kinase, partial [Candidatus Heimdallarchaeaceae archaeon]
LTTIVLFTLCFFVVMSNTPYPGFFICLEGIDGSGKTTHARLLVKNLQEQGYVAVYTTEPTRWSIPGRKLRESFFAPERLPVEEEFKLFLQDRILHIKEEVRPQLEEGKVVITDRYYFSSVAYQGSRGLDWRYILEENERVAIIPDLVILIDIPVNVALERISVDRSEGINTFEKKENLAKVRDIYLNLAEIYPELIKMVKSVKEKENTQKEILEIVKKEIEGRSFSSSKKNHN